MYVSSAWSSWFISDKQWTLNLFFCVAKPLYGQFFDWNCCVDIGSEGKIWKSVQNSLFSKLFNWKNEDKSLGNVKFTYPFPCKQWTFSGLFQAPGKNVLIKNMVHTCAFSGKSQKFVIFVGKMQEISALEAILAVISKFFVKYLSFPHPDISLMMKNFVQIKVYPYFNKGDA